MTPFTLIARDPRLKDIPIVLETPLSAALNPNEDSYEIWKTEIEVLNALSYEGSSYNRDEEREELLKRIEGVVGRKRLSKGSGAGVDGSLDSFVVVGKSPVKKAR